MTETIRNIAAVMAFLMSVFFVTYPAVNLRQLRRGERLNVFLEKAREDGRVVTARLCKSSYHYHNEESQKETGTKYGYMAWYSYSLSQTGPMYTSDRFMGTGNPSRTVKLYVDPDDPSKSYTYAQLAAKANLTGAERVFILIGALAIAAAVFFLLDYYIN